MPVRDVVEPDKGPAPGPSEEPPVVELPSTPELEDKPEREPERVGIARTGELVEDEEWLRWWLLDWCVPVNFEEPFGPAELEPAVLAELSLPAKYLSL